MIDALKVVACQLIVLHHLAFYGPMSDVAAELAPALVSWFSQDARMAVQVFLVVAGFLAARSLAPKGIVQGSRPIYMLWQRYVRVGLPLLLALVVAVLCSDLAGHWMVHDSIPGDPTAAQFLAHVFMLNGLLGVESLSAGVWYVAIDMQLYALTLLILFAARALAPKDRSQAVSWTLVLVVSATLSAMFYFNLDAQWDNWALYFFGAYGLGMLAYWVSVTPTSVRFAAWTTGMVLVTLLALSVAFRPRLALALCTAVLLIWSMRTGVIYSWPRHWAIAYGAKVSYAVFLLNFPVSLVVSAMFTRFASPTPEVQMVGVLVAWLACQLAGVVFYEQVERRLSWVGRLSLSSGLRPSSQGA